MDEKDKQILFELDKDARATYSHIAKKTRTSQETVRYRIERLIRLGVIQHLLTIINTPKLGYTPYQIFYKLHIDDPEKKDLIMSLSTIEQIGWIGELEGNYHLGIIFSVNNNAEINTTLEQINSSIKKYTLNKTISVHTAGIYLPRDYLTMQKRIIPEESGYSLDSPTFHPDDIDLSICKVLAKNARIPALEIGKNLGISTDTVINRMKQLKKAGIISRTLLVLNNNSLEQLHYKILIQLNDPTQQNKIINHAKGYDHCIAIIKTLAEWDLEIDIEVPTVSEMNTFLNTLFTHHKQLIKDYDILRIINMPKYTFFPAANFKKAGGIEEKKREKEVNGGTV